MRPAWFPANHKPRQTQRVGESGRASDLVQTMPQRKMQSSNRQSVNAKAYPVLRDPERNRLCPDAGQMDDRQNSKMRTATLNIGTLTGKGREVTAVMMAIKIDGCVCKRPDEPEDRQEVKP